MGLRESLNGEKGPKIGAAVAGGAILIAIVVWFASSGNSATATRRDAMAFYTVDDGATWFKDVADRVPPFQHDGKTAYRVFIYTTDGGVTQKAGYLQRYNAAAKKMFDAKAEMPISISSLEVKAPGAAGAWVSRNTKAGMEIVNVKPLGTKGDIEFVIP